MKRLSHHHHLNVALRTLLLCYTLLKSSRAECNISSVCAGFKASMIATDNIVLTPPDASEAFWQNCTLSINNTIHAPPTITALIPGATYEVTYTCHNCCKEFTTKPRAVRDLHVTEVTESSVSLNWTQPEGQSSSYVVNWNGGTNSTTTRVSNVTIGGLRAGFQYTFNVTALANDNHTGGTSTNKTVCTNPEMIRNFTLCNITTSSVCLQWSPPDGESSFYVVEWSDGNELNKNESTNQTVFHVDSLTAGELYYFAVAAVAGDRVSKGVVFNSSHATKPNTIAPPSVRTTTSSIYLNWTSPAGVVSMYRLEWDNGGTQLNMTTYGPSALLADLAAGTTYTIKVIAVAKDNQTEGEPFVLSAVTKPGVVSGLRMAAVTTSSVSVSWTAPQGNVSSYTVTWRSAAGGGTTNGTGSGATTSHTVTGLSAGVLYNITVAAVAGNITNEGARALVSTFTRPEKPGSITVVARATDSLNLSWVPPSGHVQYYNLSVRNTDLNFWANRTWEEPTANLSGLKPGRVYEVTVTAVAGPFTNTSDQIPLATVPTAPGVMVVTQRNTTALHVEWSPPHAMEGAPHTSYHVSYRAATGGAAAQNMTSTTNHTVLSSLSSGTLFNITVQTVGPHGFRSVWTPAPSAYTLPKPVRDLMASPESTTSVKVQWSHPEGYQPYFTYRIQTSNHTSTELVNTNSTVVTGLRPGTRYTLHVTAVAAPDSHSTTEQTFSYTMPKAVSGLSAVDMNTTAIQLTWDRQDDFKDTYSYLVSVEDTGVNVSVHTETHTFTHLTPGQHYTFTVLTLVEGVKSHPESISRNTQPAAVPDIKAIGNTSTMWVSWGVAGGRVDSYSVLLHRGGLLEGNRSGLSNHTLQVLFEGLTPGALYTATVVSASGPLFQNSTAVNATFPNPPGPIVVESQTTACINVSWARPGGMEPDQYNFMVFHADRSNQTSNNWMLLDHLQSGTAYNISVVTVGVRDYLSTVETTLNYTKPHSVSMLKEAGISPTEVMLVWDQLQSRPGYSYVVLVTSSESSFTSDMVPTTGYNASGLQSGTNYTFTVTTQTEDGTQASPTAVSYFTRPYGVSSLEASTCNSTTILLTWNRPPQNRSAYTYRVETARSGDVSINSTVVPGERAQLSGLTPGTNYSFCVFVRAQDDTEGTPSCMSQYTKPEAVQPAVSNDGSNSSMRVWWTAPAGAVERYVVHLNDSSNTLELDASQRSMLFSSLSAGRLYTARVTAASGPFNATSGFITSATFPNPPGSMNTRTTTSTIQTQWGEAPLMTNASFHYAVSSHTSHQEGGMSVNVSTNNTTHTFHRLVSGTPYDICTATVGPLGFTSQEVCSRGVTTNPEDVTSLAASPAEESISLSWEKPAGYQQSYRYYVSWANSSGLHADNITTEHEERMVQQLIPGSSYHFNVTTETVNGIQAATVSVSTCTDSSPVSGLQCQNPNNGTEARLVLAWGQPKGLNSGFNVSAVERADGNAKTTKTTCDECGDVTVLGLKYHTLYDLTVVTLSCGRASVPVHLDCTTGITVPPVPSESVLKSLVKESSKEHDRFSLHIDSGLFNSSGGPITHYGVMVTNQLEGVDTNNLQQYLVKTYEDWSKDSETSPMYLATVGKLSGPGRSGDSPSVSVQIGDTSLWDSYSNGVLTPGDQYRYAIVLFTQLMSSAGLVDVKRSFVSIIIHPVPVDLPNTNIMLIAIGVGVSLGILFIIIIGAVLYCRRSSRKGAPTDIQIHSMRNKVSLAVRVEDYEAYYRKQKADSSCGFAEEFEDLKPVGTAQARTSALALENKPNNRYNNVLPYDASRVKLSVHGSPFDDYINANYIPGYNSRKEFIAAQGPLPCTVTEFWRMIWEKNVMTLVMLTRCNEQGRVKCEEYWPAQVKQFGNITVTTTSEIPLEDWTIREFSIKNVRTAESRSVRHFHFTAWPDHGVPETAELLINFRHLVREHMDQYSRHSPTVVHCSAGVGRTGTFIAIDRLIFQIERDGIVDVYGIIHDLRMHRTLMVQTEDQYVFLNQCAMDIIRSRTGTNVDLIYQNTAALTIYENFEPRRS